MRIDGESDQKMSKDLCAPGPVILTRVATSHTFDVGANLGRRTLDLDPAIPSNTRVKLYDAYVAYSWANGWSLLSKSKDGGGIFSCFNPSLSWPENYIELPSSYLSGMIRDKGPDAPPIKAGFSALPTKNGHWTLLVVGGRRTFSTFSRGQEWWTNYDFGPASGEGRLCVGVGFFARTGEFLCLFEKGDVLIFSTKAGPRMMLSAAPQLTPAQFYRYDEIHVRAAEAAGRIVAVRWRRDEELCGGGDNFRLMGVVREATAPPAAAAEEEEEMVGGKVVRRGSIWAQGRKIEINSVHGNRSDVLSYTCFLIFIVLFVLWFKLFLWVERPAGC